MRVEWDRNRCALAGLCSTPAPEVFTITEDAQLAISTDYDESDRIALQQAADACPTQAITLVD
jgi:ferredoxin